jgi:hypothetical protein
MYLRVSVFFKKDALYKVKKVGEGEIKESSGEVNSSMIYLIHCKNFYKSHNVPPPAQQ